MTFLAAAGTSNDHSGHASTRDLVTELVRELREVEHWRRLVAARLDLAVAAVTSIDEPCARPLPSTPPLPCDLRHLVGLDHHPVGETTVLERLRRVLRDLDTYADALHATILVAEQEAAEALGC